MARIGDSSTYLAEHMAEVPVLVVPCIVGRTDGLSGAAQAGKWGSILPAVREPLTRTVHWNGW